ncbi:MAG TPA: isochorismatase family protein [Candidatus Acidoferrum sp.]
MPLTKLNDVAALVVVDLQKGIVSVPTVHPTSEVVQRSATLARAFRERKLPVVLVNVTGTAPGRVDTPRPNFAPPPDWADLAPELDTQPRDYLVSKKRWGAFIGTDLDAHLRSRNVTQVFITGVSTSAGVESTARSAYDLGYHVVVVTDAVTDRNPESHRRSIEAVFPRLAESTTTADVLKHFESRSH